MFNKQENATLSERFLKEIQVVYQKGYYQDKEWAADGVTHQFIENAEAYHQHYFDRLDFVHLIDLCLTHAKIDRNRHLDILDIGSGSGSSVFAACKLLKDAHIVACDISPQLLEMLTRFVEQKEELKGRITACCFDLHRPFFKPECFDLVIGAAILHHLTDPYEALKNVANTVRPAGKLIFVEPLEAGNLMLMALFDRLLDVLASLGQAKGTLPDLFKALRLDFEARLGVPVPKPWTAVLDDKWLFGHAYLRSLSEQLGFERVDIFPAQPDLMRIFEESVLNFLQVTGLSATPLPPEALAVIREFDEGVSTALKAQFCPTGIIVFSKPGTVDDAALIHPTMATIASSAHRFESHPGAESPTKSATSCERI